MFMHVKEKDVKKYFYYCDKVLKISHSIKSNKVNLHGKARTMALKRLTNMLV